MTARESFLSFARGAFRTKTAYDYSDKTTAVARQDAVYTYLKEQPYYPPHMPNPPSPLSPIWHLLSWCVVALEEHLSEAPERKLSEPTESEVGMVARMVYPTNTFTPTERALVAAAIRQLDEYRAGKRGEG